MFVFVVVGVFVAVAVAVAGWRGEKLSELKQRARVMILRSFDGWIRVSWVNGASQTRVVTSDRSFLTTKQRARLRVRKRERWHKGNRNANARARV